MINKLKKLKLVVFININQVLSTQKVEEIIKQLVNIVNSKYPNANICGYENGYVENKQAAFEKIATLTPDVVLVALGIPAQEKLIYKHLDEFDKGIFVGVGGSFDVISGHKKRAPKIFIKLKD